MAVPQESRQATLSLAFVLFGFTFFSATMMAGGKLGAALGLSHQLLVVVIIGNLALALYASALSSVAFRTGYSTVLMARHCFGTEGSRLADLLLGLTQIGWYAWGTETISKVLIQVLNWPEWVYWPLCVFAGFGFCATAAIGYKGLEFLSKLMVPLMSLLIILSSLKAFQESSWSQASSPPGMELSVAITIVIGTFVSGATQSTNWTRYAKTKRSAIYVSFLAFFLGNGMMVAYGALAGAVYAESDIVEVLLGQGFFLSALLMLLANIWTTQDNTIYNFSLAGCHFFRTENRRGVTLVGAAIGTVLALAGFSDYLVPFLLLLGSAIPPLGGVILAEFFLAKERSEALEPGEAPPAFLWWGLLSYALGLGAALTLPGIAPLNGVFGAFLSRGLLLSLGFGRDSRGRR